MDYVFSADPLVAHLYPGCTGPDLANNYLCGELTLIEGDTVKIDRLGSTIRFGGQVTLGANTTINKGGQSADLTLDLGASIFLGAHATITANVITTSSVTLDVGSTVYGTISTSTSLGMVVTKEGCVVTGAISATDGAITIGNHNTVNGLILAMAGAITIGSNSQIQGAITASAGAITVGNYSQVYGDITASAGAVTVGFNSVVYAAIFARSGIISIDHDTVIEADINGGVGNITTGENVMLGTALNPRNIYSLAGIVTLGANNIIGNVSTHAGGVFVGKGSKILSISSMAGNITIQDNAVIGPITSTVGIITLLKNIIVNGNILSGDGAVNVESYSRVCGDIGVTGAGLVTVTTNVGIGGNITSDVGAITVGGSLGNLTPNTTVGGTIASNIGTLSIAFAIVGGNIISNGTMTVINSAVGGSISGGTITNTLDHATVSIAPPNCTFIPLPELPIVGSTASGLFDCLETGGQTAALYTKLAGTSFTFDIVALKIDKTIENNYVVAGDPPKYTRVELFDDATPPASCAAYANPVAAQTIAFTSSSAGRAPTSAFNLSNVYQKLRCRVTECTDNTCTTISATAKQSCSSDQFSVRPVAVTLISSANALAPSSTATPIIKAGALFNLSANTISGDHYSGVLTLDSNKLTVENPNQDITQPNNGVIGTLTPANLTANTAAVNNATYSEVGYLYLAPGAYRDDSFTAVDSVNGDCMTSTVSDSHLSTVLMGAQYGCSIGNINAVSLGRFVPDHLGVVGAVITRSDLQTTESQAVPFTYMDEPMQLALTVTAYNKSEGATFNYQGKFAKLNTTDWSATDLSHWTCSDLSCMGLSANNGTMPLTDRLAIDTTRLNSKVPRNTTTLGGSIDAWSKGSSYFTVNILLKRYVNLDLKINPKGYVSPDGPYDNLKLGAKPLDLDGVTLPPNAASDTLHCVNLNITTGLENTRCTFISDNDNDLRRKIAETPVRFGQLQVSNAYGSERLDLPILVEVQYWNGSSFATNTFDNNTMLTVNNLVEGNYQGALSGATLTTPTFRVIDKNDSCSVSSVLSGVMTAGKSCLLLSKPFIIGSFDLLINLGNQESTANCLISSLTYGSSVSATLPYLSGNGCGAAYDKDPVAHITWGIYKDNGKGSNGLIYFREVY